ncbi:hypothetical protein [Streptomyces sp. NPDC053048]|uniref:hypothetical protein n=1 Tax=Streptomyces sp. NPDC053048 TaxID=3365694 RepID=UPI0037CFFADE
MTELIHWLLLWALFTLAAFHPNPPRTPGKHAVKPVPAEEPTPTRRIHPWTGYPVNVWHVPWRTVAPEHVQKREALTIEDDGPMIRRYYLAYMALPEEVKRRNMEERQRIAEILRQHERRARELRWATLGFDYPGVKLRGHEELAALRAGEAGA